MVEHQTENLGVRGSNPFTGSLFNYLIVNSFLIKRYKSNNLVFILLVTIYKKQSLNRHVGLLTSKINRLKPINLVTYPAFINSYFIFFKFFSKNVGSPLINSWLLTKYLGQLSLSYSGFKLVWAFVDIRTSFNKLYFDYWWRCLYRRRLLKFFYSSKSFFYNWFVQLSYFKEPQGLVVFIKKAFYTIYLKRHKRIFSCVSRVLSVWFHVLSKSRNIKGYSFFFKGKLAKAGSVRKNIFFCKKGLTSFTNKSLRVNTRAYQVWTVTGSIGAGVSIFYKAYVYTDIFIHSNLRFNVFTDLLLFFCT